MQIKNLNILLENRTLDDIIIVDTNMHHFTLHLTNGMYLPPYAVEKDSEDEWLVHLCGYLLTFLGVSNVREKIIREFNLDQMFEENRQTKACKSIKSNHEVIMQDVQKEKVKREKMAGSFEEDEEGVK